MKKISQFCTIVPVHDILSFYCTCIRPVLEYCSPVFHHALPGYLSDDLERIQKRALSIISPYSSYSDSLITYNIGTLKDRRQKLCKNLFDNVVRIRITSYTICYLLKILHIIISEDTVLLSASCTN